MPSVSSAQHRAMEAAAHGHSTLGIPEKVGKEFVSKDALAGAIRDALEPAAQPHGITELDVAKAIQSGELASPQAYENVLLFALRITGTGTSYRRSLDEYVYRPPEHFLSDDFVQRCNGLPVVFEHPKSGTLDTDEYRERAVGTVVLPYIKDDEVWGIAKIFDADAAQLMQTSHVSTSPAVVFRDAESTESFDMGDGKTLLIEGKPSYLDHLAICEEGVWDKGGEPSGIQLTEEANMADESMAPAWADELGKRFDAICSRLDAIEGKKDEEKKADAEKPEDEKAEAEKADKARKDESAKEEGKAEEKEEHKAEKEIKAAEKEGDKEEKKDSARADAATRENADLKRRIAEMEAQIHGVIQPMSASDRDELAKAQARADSLARMLGDEVTAALGGEKPIAYRKRLAARFQKHSPSVKTVKLDSLDAESFAVIEERIYADAMQAALNPNDGTAGRLIPQVYRDSSGREITKFHGDIGAWMAPFMSPGLSAVINRRKEAA